MVVAKECHIRMYLVGYHNDMVLIAEMGQALQRLPGPADAGRVVRITQNQQATLVVGNL